MSHKTHECEVSRDEKGVVRIRKGFRREVRLSWVLKDGGDLNRHAGEGVVGNREVACGEKLTRVAEGGPLHRLSKEGPGAAEVPGWERGRRHRSSHALVEETTRGQPYP